MTDQTPLAPLDIIANRLYVAVVQPDTVWWDDLTPEMQDAWRRGAEAAQPAPLDERRSYRYVHEDGDYTIVLGQPAPLDERYRALVEAGIEALRLTREYVGEDTLPAIPGWSWFDWTQAALAALEDSPKGSDARARELPGLGGERD